MQASGFIRNKRSGFAQVSNSCLRNPNLSLSAKGLYSLIQSLITNTDFKIYKSVLQRDFCKEGKSAFNTAWKELINSGFLKMYKINTPEGFIYEYELLDEPEHHDSPPKGEGSSAPISESKKKDSSVSPDTDFPPLGNPALGIPEVGDPDMENPSSNNTYESNTYNKKINKQTANSDYDNAFSLPPLSFLISKQKGRPISDSDRKVVEYLTDQMQFSNELANILIEHTLKKCNDILNFNYISKVAATFVRKGIDNKQKAVDYLSGNSKVAKETNKPVRSRRGVQEVPMPSYWETRDDFSRETLSDEKLSELQRLQKEMEK